MIALSEKSRFRHRLSGTCVSASIFDERVTHVVQSPQTMPEAGWAAAIMASTRRLAAILAAEVAGYSRLMGVDEEGTLARLKAHRRQLIDPKIAEYRGRVVKTAGGSASMSAT
jgi:class 3 adenylate cyclase